MSTPQAGRGRLAASLRWGGRVGQVVEEVAIAGQVPHTTSMLLARPTSRTSSVFAYDQRVTKVHTYQGVYAATAAEVTRRRCRRRARPRCCQATRPRFRGCRCPATTRPLGDEINRDPIEEFGGVNLFCFVMNRPVLKVDADGRFILSPLPLWPAKGLCALVLTIIDKYNYPNMRHLHCMASCHISRLCGPDTSASVGLIKELWDLVNCLATGSPEHCNSALQPSDFLDNARGLCPSFKSCADQCSSLQNAPETPGPLAPWGRE